MGYKKVRAQGDATSSRYISVKEITDGTAMNTDGSSTGQLAYNVDGSTVNGWVSNTSFAIIWVGKLNETGSGKYIFDADYSGKEISLKTSSTSNKVDFSYIGNTSWTVSDITLQTEELTTFIATYDVNEGIGKCYTGGVLQNTTNNLNNLSNTAFSTNIIHFGCNYDVYNGNECDADHAFFSIVDLDTANLNDESGDDNFSNVFASFIDTISKTSNLNREKIRAAIIQMEGENNTNNDENPSTSSVNASFQGAYWKLNDSLKYDITIENGPGVYMYPWYRITKNAGVTEITLGEVETGSAFIAKGILPIGLYLNNVTPTIQKDNEFYTFQTEEGKQWFIAEKFKSDS